MTRYGAAVRPRHHLPRRRPLRPRRPEHVCRCRRRDPRRAVRRGHLPPPRHALRAAGDPDDRLPAARRLAPIAGPAHRRPGRPAGRRRRRRRDVLRRHRGGRCPTLEAAVERVDPCGRHPGRPRRRPLHRLPRRQGRRERPRPRPHLDDPLRRARRHRRHRVRVAVGPRPADAPAHRVGCPARRPVPPGRAARLLAAAGDARLDGRAADAVLRDDRDRAPRAARSASPRRSPSPPTSATASSSRSTSTSATPATPRARAPPSPAGSRPASCSTRCAASASSCPSSGSTSSRSARPTTTPTSPPRWPTALCSRPFRPSPASGGTSATGPAGTPRSRCSRGRTGAIPEGHIAQPRPPPHARPDPRPQRHRPPKGGQAATPTPPTRRRSPDGHHAEGPHRLGPQGAAHRRLVARQLPTEALSRSRTPPAGRS